MDKFEIEPEQPGEYEYPTLETVCWHGLDDLDERVTDENAKEAAKRGPAAAAAERAAQAARAAASIVDHSGLRSSRKQASPTSRRPQQVRHDRSPRFVDKGKAS